MEFLDEHVQQRGTLIFTSHTKDYEGIDDHILEINHAAITVIQ